MKNVWKIFPVNRKKGQDDKVQKEDFFLKQIDEFKEKAKYLQSLLMTKESKVEELDGVLEEKKEKTESFQKILDGQKQEADKLTQSVRVQVDALISRVDAQLRVMDEAISCEINTLEERISEQIVEMNSNSRQGMAELDKKIQDFSSVSVRQMEEQKKAVRLAMEEVKDELAKINKEVEKLTEDAEGGDDTDKKFEDVKAELGEKIHKENVKCYRNIQTLLEELEAKIEQVEIGSQSMKVVKSYFGVLIILGIINFAGILAIIAHLFGFF